MNIRVPGDTGKKPSIAIFEALPVWATAPAKQYRTAKRMNNAIWDLLFTPVITRTNFLFYS
jgi:hypothetical protein